ncbi:hypothetical protein GCM10022243_40300 [Saccharothrix violaceirubra]
MPPHRTLRPKPYTPPYFRRSTSRTAAPDTLPTRWSACPADCPIARALGLHGTHPPGARLPPPRHTPARRPPATSTAPDRRPRGPRLVGFHHFGPRHLDTRGGLPRPDPIRRPVPLTTTHATTRTTDPRTAPTPAAPRRPPGPAERRFRHAHDSPCTHAGPDLATALPPVQPASNPPHPRCAVRTDDRAAGRVGDPVVWPVADAATGQVAENRLKTRATWAVRAGRHAQ